MTQTKTRRPQRTYTDEFKNKVIDEFLEAFDIDHSLSMKEYSYNKAIVEADIHTHQSLTCKLNFRTTKSLITP